MLPLTHARTFFRIGAQLYDNLLQMRATMVRGGGTEAWCHPLTLMCSSRGRWPPCFHRPSAACSDKGCAQAV